MTDPARSDGDPPPAKGETGERPYEPIFNLPGVVMMFIALCAGIHVVRAVVLGPDTDFAFLVRFAFIPIRYTGDFGLDLYAFVSPLSYSLLHGGWAHLVINMIWLAAFGSPLANRIGPARFVWFWIATALAAVLLHFVLYASEAVPLVGASGAISGMMGAAARYGFRIRRATGKPAFAGAILPFSAVFRSRTTVTFLAVWMVVNLVAGIGLSAGGGQGGIAWEAHIGGFLAGFLGIRLFDRPLPPARQPLRA